MNTDNQPTPDDSYRKAWQQVFDEAAESPPPRVWDAVERQLDGDGQSRVVPLWATVRPWVTGIAAAVAFVLAGWWAWQSPTPDTKTAQSTIDQSSATATLDEPNKGAEAGTKLAKAKQKKPATYAGIAPKSRRLTDRTRAHQPHEETALVDPPNQGVLSPASPLVTPEIKLGAGVGDSLLAGVSHGKQPTTGIDAPDRENPGRLDAMEPLAGASQAGNPTALMPKMELIASEQKIALASPKSTDEARSLPSVERLAGKAFRNHPLAIQRVVWFRNDEPLVTETEQVKPVGREKWASISAMPLSFNPVLGVQLQPQFQSFNFTNSDTYSFAANRVAAKTPSLRSESGGAVLVQISAGTQLTDRWSVEAGVGYLQAQSTVEGPARLNASIDMSVDADQTLYTAVVWDAINRNKVSTTAPGLVNVNANKAYDVQTALYAYQGTGRTRNDYSFVQVPVQVGFQLRPRRKLGLSLLGGLITNWFVRNRVGETLVVKPGDDVYRSLTLSGTAGARLRYRSSRRWSASLAGVFQQSLQLVTPTDVDLQVRPRTVGASLGVDYHF